MADQDVVSRPIQVFLNTGQFISLRETRQRGGNRDFFAGDDRGFSRHKSAIRERIRDASETLRRDGQSAGFIVVQMREEALAKSYRPLNALFSLANSFPLVGGGSIGEMFFQCTPNALDRLDDRIEERAEVETRYRQNATTGQLQPRPTTYRSELGAIDDIRLPMPVDRITFSAREAAEWLNRRDILGGYIVEIFQPHSASDPDAVRAMVTGFRQRLAQLGGIVALPLFSGQGSRSIRSHLAMSIHLTRNREQSYISLPIVDSPPTHEELQRITSYIAPQDVAIPVERHQYFLDQMGVEPLVRRVTLPPSWDIDPLEPTHVAESSPIPTPPNGSLPVVGIVDGGVADFPMLSAWRSGSTDPIDAADLDFEHGTFIAGPVTGSRILNPHIDTSLEPKGCQYYDIPLIPRRGLFQNYYALPSEFMDQLEEEVIRAKRDARVRVFNFSLGAVGARQGFGYTAFAKALDDIAIEHDVLFVVSAGNLNGTEVRDPWPADGDEAVRLLASGGAVDERILAPAEQLLGLSVGAVNPPGVLGQNEGLPTVYTRRGPGVGGARKPDLTHYGGALSLGGHGTGLVSLASDGAVVDNRGTSFAAPLVASTVATIDHRLEGTVPRETLIALVVHRAQRCQAMQHQALDHVARDFVGFGMAPPADICLSDEANSVTLVFSETLAVRRELQFIFAWPRSLVTTKGKCRGRVDLTLAFTPPIDAQFDAECVRVQLEACLHQIEIDPNTGDDDPQSRLKHYDSAVPMGLGYTEKYLLKTGLKWTPVKRYSLSMPRGRGKSSNWRLGLRSLTRAGEQFPDSGVPFTIIMTISDPRGTAPVYDEIRNEITRRGLELADITVAHRVRARN